MSAKNDENKTEMAISTRMNSAYKGKKYDMETRRKTFVLIRTDDDDNEPNEPT